MAGQEMLGDDFLVYYDDESDWLSPDWSAQISVGSIGFEPGNEQVEIPLRLMFKFYKKGRADWDFTFDMNYDPTNPFHTAVRNAIRNGTRIHLALAEGNIPASDYLHAWFFVSGPLDASLDAPATYSVSAKLHHDVGSNQFPAYVEGL